MRYIQTDEYSIELGSILDSSFQQLLSENYSDAKKIIIVDENTHDHCLSYLITNFQELMEAEVILIPTGEQSKQISLAYNIWEALTDYGITRHDLIINLGGGVVSDLGGFLASCYKRGIDFINIPTSLLAMVDASIGGKTGVNLGHFKNQVGVFTNPKGLFIDMVFLETLPESELLNGYAEMLKHGIISNKELFDEVCSCINKENELSYDLLQKCIEVKNNVVQKDPFEDGYRKILNFGHTIGHVIEGLSMDEEVIPHGHAVGIGMVMEAHLSHKLVGLSDEEYEFLESYLLEIYPLPKISDEDIQEMVSMLGNDKKNRSGKILCSLIPKIGECSYDNIITEEQVLETFLHFKNKQVSLN